MFSLLFRFDYDQVGHYQRRTRYAYATSCSSPIRLVLVDLSRIASFSIGGRFSYLSTSVSFAVTWFADGYCSPETENRHRHGTPNNFIVLP
jgi:hypothetical protein